MVTFIIIVFPVLSTLASHGTFRRDAKDDARKKPEQIRCIGFPRVMETKRELYADNGFEEDEVGIGHSRKTWLGLEIENAVKRLMGSSGKYLCDVDNEEIPKFYLAA